MPRLPAIHDATLRALADELRFAPRPALLKHLDRAETLASVIEPEQQYPPSWVIFRVTGFRPEHADGAPSSGEALLASLSAFVEHLCESASIMVGEVGDDTVSPEGLCARWGIGRKTLDRARRKGLVGRRVRGDGPTRMLVFTPAAIEAYERRANPGPSAVGRRMSQAVRTSVLRRAERYHETLGYSINQAAQRLGPRFGFSPEAVRLTIKKHDERAGSNAIFNEPGPPTVREQAFAYRAMRRGLEPVDIGQRLGRSRNAVWRAANAQRERLLRTLDLSGPIAPTFDRLDAGEILLPEAIRCPSTPVRLATDVFSLLAQASATGKPLAQSEKQLTLALHFLRWRAATVLAGMNPSTHDATPLDAIETDLRRASRVKERLMVSTLGLMLATLEKRLDVSPVELPPRDLVTLCQVLLRSAAGAIDGFDPLHGGRLAAPVGLAFDRAAAGWIARRTHLGSHEDRRAKRVLTPQTSLVVIGRTTDPWQFWLEPDARVEFVLDRLEEEHGMIVAVRFGLAGHWPQTLVEVSAGLGITHMHAALRERDAIRNALALARGTMSP